MKGIRVLNRLSARGWLLAGAALLVALIAACGGATTSEPTPTSTSGADSSGAAVAGTTAAARSAGGSDTVLLYSFPTGPAVTVAEGYTPPGDHVPETGTYLPANGKPTLVFVDAIW